MEIPRFPRKPFGDQATGSPKEMLVPKIQQDVNLLPPDHAFRQVVNWSYLDQFLEAHGYTGNEVSTWCRSHVEYPLRLHKALLDYSLGNNQKSFRQTLNDVEAVIATAISDEGGSLLHHF
ncbi:unnamed protein product [Cladocopium goreaui]|uniref:Syndetin C-terminal domain-containing protein n=1 Tax=Cladocopium goreaui TaxID=2562237 RepID=A0A9P1CNV6_9DINO|nr:unnamed protein product [Cladocopium goreaui]